MLIARGEVWYGLCRRCGFSCFLFLFWVGDTDGWAMGRDMRWYGLGLYEVTRVFGFEGQCVLAVLHLAMEFLEL